MIVGPTFFSSGETGDPFWSSVILLLHFDDAGGTTLPVDSSSFSQTLFVATAGLEVALAEKKFGSGAFTSMLVSKAGRVTFQPGTEGNAEEYTIEFWLHPTAIDNYNFGFTFSNLNGIILLAGPLDPSYSGRMLCVNGGLASIASTSTIALNAWTHVALTRQQTSPGIYTTRMFINGVKESESTAGLPPLSANVWRIGQTDTAGFSAIRGYLDDMRITTVCRYTADFTPPTAAFPDGP